MRHRSLPQHLANHLGVGRIASVIAFW